MDFTSYNKNNFEKIDWGRNTENFQFRKLGDFYAKGVKVIQVFGFFFTKSENYGLQPIAIASDCLVNLPTHKKDIISDMLNNKDAVEAIKDGECGLAIREYKSKYNKDCFDFDFVNVATTHTQPATPATPANTNVQPPIF